MEFKVGNKVQSKYSINKMIVNGVHSGKISCKWYDGDQTFSTLYDPDELELCEEPLEFKYGLEKDVINECKNVLKTSICKKVSEVFKNREFEDGYKFILKHIQFYFHASASRGKKNDIARGKFLQPLQLENLPNQKIPSKQFIEGIREGLKDLSDNELKLSLLERDFSSDENNEITHYTIEFQLKTSVKPDPAEDVEPVVEPITYHDWKFLPHIDGKYQWCSKCGVVYMGQDKDRVENMVLYQYFLIPGFTEIQEKPYGSMVKCTGK